MVRPTGKVSSLTANLGHIFWITMPAIVVVHEGRVIISGASWRLSNYFAAVLSAYEPL